MDLDVRCCPCQRACRFHFYFFFFIFTLCLLLSLPFYSFTLWMWSAWSAVEKQKAKKLGVMRKKEKNFFSVSFIPIFFRLAPFAFTLLSEMYPGALFVVSLSSSFFLSLLLPFVKTLIYSCVCMKRLFAANFQAYLATAICVFMYVCKCEWALGASSMDVCMVEYYYELVLASVQMDWIRKELVRTLVNKIYVYPILHLSLSSSHAFYIFLYFFSFAHWKWVGRVRAIYTAVKLTPDGENTKYTPNEEEEIEKNCWNDKIIYIIYIFI